MGERKREGGDRNKCINDNAEVFHLLKQLHSTDSTRYRVGHLLADLGCVDLDLESSQAGGPLL